MISCTVRGLVTAVVLVTMGCAGDGYDEVLVDTTGVRVKRSCSETDCDYEFLDDPGCGDATPSLVGLRRISVCSGPEGATFSENCRALTCTEDVTCKIFSTPYECIGGLCERAQWPFEYDGSPDDIVAACFADSPRSDTCRTTLLPSPENRASEAIETNCQERECTIPEQCVDP